MQQKTSLCTTLEAAELKEKYDGHVKRILSHREILAWILKETVEELAGFSVEEIKGYIEPEIQVANILLQGRSSRIVGDNTESFETGEEYITFDLRFSIYVPCREQNESIKMLINIEAQKSFHEKYSLVTRGIFYCARMVSTQQGTEFEDSKYDALKKVYSIWICMNVPHKVGNAITKYALAQEKVQGVMEAKKCEFDKMALIMVCLDEESSMEERSLHHMLNTLFSNKIDLEKKIEILENMYGMKMSKEMQEEVREMCNWSEAFEERGIQQGIQACVLICQKFGISKETAINEVMEKFSKDFFEASEAVDLYWV
ncbi:MAG: hypothetical protein IJ282_07965 [Lachnospiraceae bacterium]|nr:hypothetical protein [Lachnospiraceae bacterium]